ECSVLFQKAVNNGKDHSHGEQISCHSRSCVRHQITVFRHSPHDLRHSICGNSVLHCDKIAQCPALYSFFERTDIDRCTRYPYHAREPIGDPSHSPLPVQIRIVKTSQTSCCQQTQDKYARQEKGNQFLFGNLKLLIGKSRIQQD